MVSATTTIEPMDDNALNGAVAEARAQVAEGKGIPLEDVTRWLEAWGTADEAPLEGKLF